jgi:hypothetical protein
MLPPCSRERSSRLCNATLPKFRFGVTKRELSLPHSTNSASASQRLCVTSHFAWLSAPSAFSAVSPIQDLFILDARRRI